MVSVAEFHLAILVIAFCMLPIFAGSLSFVRVSVTNLIVLLLCISWVFGLFELLALPITNWCYPLNVGVNSQWLGCFLLGLLFVVVLAFWGLSSIFHEHGSRRFWLRIAGFHEGFLLLLLPRACHDEYKWHIRWRFELWGRKILRHWQHFSAPDFFRRNRWFWVICAGGLAAILALFVLSEGAWFKLPTADQLAKMLESNGSWTLLTALISAPIAFVIWWFRDINTLWQIENQRKDINLKDFQKLAEWASGLHLIEDKTISVKRKLHEGGLETAKTIESTVLSPQQVLSTPSRREGAASLQIAAVVQLEAFLNGDFGRHFEKPAFTLLTSIWLSLMQKHTESFDAQSDRLIRSLREKTDWKNAEISAFNRWRDEFRRDAQHTPLAKAITQALAAKRGLALSRNKELLPRLLLSGMDYGLPGLDMLGLDNLDLQGIQWQCANLEGAQLQGTRLFRASLQGATLNNGQLQGASLVDVQLQGAELKDCKLQGAKLSGAKLQGAQLNKAQLQVADLSWAELNHASMREVQLQGADLTAADLRGVDMHASNLMNTSIVNATWDEHSRFSGAKTDLDTAVTILDSPFGDGSDAPLPLLTHAARWKLRDQNCLTLPEERYTEFQIYWDNASQWQRDQAMAVVGTQVDYTGDPV